jgi:hypothetical protein
MEEEEEGGTEQLLAAVAAVVAAVVVAAVTRCRSQLFSRGYLLAIDRLQSFLFARCCSC